MPVLRINASDKDLQVHSSATPIHRALAVQSPDHGPVVIMVHGYKYAPNDPNHCPHKKIFNDSDAGWPKQLGFAKGQQNEGLCIAFGWYARGPLWQAHRRAVRLGKKLATLVTLVRDAEPRRPVHVIAHSLGSEIALSALAHLKANSIDRMVLLTGASFASKARSMLSTPAGLTTELFNVTSRENDLFDLAFEHLVAAPKLNDRAIGQGIDTPNTLNLQLDCPTTLKTFADLGLTIAQPQRRICHWSGYTRPGVMALYAHILRSPNTFSQTNLAQILPTRPAPRWSRFLAPHPKSTRPITLPGLPLALKLKNRIMAATSLQGKDNEPAY